MKIILTILFISFSLFGAEIDDFALEMKYFRDYDTAFLKAKEENKPLMLVVVEDGCAWCKKFERTTLADKKVKQKVLDVVPLIIDQKHERDKFPRKYSAVLFPSTSFIDAKEDERFFIFRGYIKKNNFLLILKDIKSKFEDE